MSDAKSKGPRNTDVLPVPKAVEGGTTLPSSGDEPPIDFAATQPTSALSGGVDSDQAVTDRNAAPPASAGKPAGKVMLAGAAAAPAPQTTATPGASPPQKTVIDDAALQSPPAGSAGTRTAPGSSDEHVTLPAGPPRAAVAAPKVIATSPRPREPGGNLGLIIGGTLMVLAVVGLGTYLYARSEKTRRDDAPTAIPVPKGSTSAATSTAAADAGDLPTAPVATATTPPVNDPTATPPAIPPGTGTGTGTTSPDGGPFSVPSAWLPPGVPSTLPSTFPTSLPSTLPSTFPFPPPPPSSSASGG